MKIAAQTSHVKRRMFLTIAFSLTLIACIVAGSSAEDAPLDPTAVLGDAPILFTVHVPDRDGTHNYMIPSCYGKMGSQLKVFHPRTGATRVLLSAKDGIIRRPCVHFDGRRIVFSMCKTNRDKFHIYEIEIDPKTLFTEKGELAPKQLTFAEDVYDVDPIYLPDEKIAFCSTRDHKIVPCAGQLVPQIYRMDADGTNIHQITRSTVHENELSLTPDGRILYSRWDYVDRNFGDGHGFWFSNPDGCNQALAWGNNTAHPSSGWTARMVPGSGRILCILGTHHGSLGGALAVIDSQIAVDGRQSIVRTWPPEVIKRFENPAKLKLPKDQKPSPGIPKMTSIWPTEARALLATDYNYRLHGWTDDLNSVRPWYNTPFPLSEEHFLFVRAEHRGAAAAIYLGDMSGREAKLYEEAPGCYDPMPLAPHPRPAPLASPRDYENNDGHFYVQNVYEGTHMEGVEPGSIKYVRVVEALSKRGKSQHIWRALGHQEGMIGWSGFIAKRILGTAPVESDGSASFLVPSDKFVYFQLLDTDGMMIQSMRSGTSIHSGERRGCVGCHESRVNVNVSAKSGAPTKALKRAPSKLKPWYGKPRAFNYLSEVQPVFDKHCVKCHDFGGKGATKVILAGDKGFAFNASYGELQSKGYTGAIGAGPAGHLPAKTWGSHTSPLIRLLKQGHPPGKDTPKDLKLSEEEMDRIVTWIDINSPYYPTGYSARPEPPPGRNPLTRPQTGRFFRLTGLNGKLLGEASYYPGPQVSFDRPELSPCLQKITDSNARREVLTIIQAGKQSLEKLPRADMPGFSVLHRGDQIAKAHREKYAKIEQEVRAAIRNGSKVTDSAQTAP
jgi:hypothetical protein